MTSFLIRSRKAGLVYPIKIPLEPLIAPYKRFFWSRRG